MLADSNTLVSEFGPIILIVGLAMAAIGVLLPRPKRGPVLIGAMLGGLALAAAALILVRATQWTVEAILFYAFGGLALIAGVVMITHPNPARAALSFAIVVLSTCGLFLLNAAPFVMAGTIIIYAGAIVVTFLFVLMLAQPDVQSDADNRSREPVLATLAGFLLLSTLLLTLRQTYDTQDYDAWLAKLEAARHEPVEKVWEVLGNEEDFRQSTDLLMQRMLGRDAARDIVAIVQQKDDIKDVGAPGPANAAAIQGWLDRLADVGAQMRAHAIRHVGRLSPPPRDVLSPFAGTPANARAQPLSSDNVAGLGRTLFSDYLLAVELGGTLLLVAAIGAIAITQRPTSRRAA
jgi:NADH:ubiquinone oxidoreductase subunit 6 (subunit J)